MPEVEHSIEVDADLDAVWRYVEVLENWAPYVIGFQRLQQIDDRRSIWTLRGDVGILSREVDIQADITVWEPNDRVEFTVTGVTERLDGDGYFILRSLGDDTGAPSAPSATPNQAPAAAAAAARPGLFKRLRTRVARFLLRRLTRKSVAASTPDARPAPASTASASTGSASAGQTVPSAPSGGPRSSVTFKLRVSPLGPMAPMLELLMGPMLEPAAEDLANQIKADVEAASPT